MVGNYETMQEEFARLRDHQLELRDVLVDLLEDNANSFRIKRSETRLYDQIVLHDSESPEQLQQDFILSEQSYNKVVSSLKSRYPEEFGHIELFSPSHTQHANELEEHDNLDHPDLDIKGQYSWRDVEMMNAMLNRIAQDQEKEEGREI